MAKFCVPFVSGSATYTIYRLVERQPEESTSICEQLEYWRENSEVNNAR